MLVFGLLVSGTITNIIIENFGGQKKKERVETRGEERQELLQNYIMYKVHWLYELFTSLTVSQQRYFYLSFQSNDESKCTKKSYQINILDI